jgi:hypothetical protein
MSEPDKAKQQIQNLKKIDSFKTKTIHPAQDKHRRFFQIEQNNKIKSIVYPNSKEAHRDRESILCRYSSCVGTQLTFSCRFAPLLNVKFQFGC